MTNTPAFTPTNEQTQAIDMALAGDSFKIVAYAGAGKTSTLKMIGEHRHGRGLYLAFNKAIASEAQNKFPPNIHCQTFHSLAFRHVPRAITAKVALPKLTPTRLAEELHLEPIEVMRSIDGLKKPILLTKAKLGTIISEALSSFCKTSAQQPAPRHINLPKWLDDKEANTLRQTLFPALLARWQQAIDPRHQSGISHDIYLKYWTLSKPIIPADFVLFDEAQDADPLMMGVLMQQACQTIYVGDAHQQIYEWRGAVNAMKRLPYPQTLLTQSFRFGEKIAEVANLLLGALQEKIPLRGNPNCHSSLAKSLALGKKDAILCRTNAAAMNQLMRGLKLGHKVALQADSQRILRFCQGADSLKAGKSAYGVAELAFFHHWGEVQEFAESSEGSEIKTWVKLIEEYGTDTISQALNKLSTPSQADYLVTTAHKSKGLEWHSVQIGDDFLYEVNQLSVKISPEELRLLYVACTRGKSMLDIHHINNLLTGLKEKKVIYS